MKVAAVIVLYNPDEASMPRLVEKTLRQVEHLYLVDNASCRFAAGIQDERVSYLRMDGNKGIAVAQNAALRKILQSDFDYILFGDQDSVIPENAVAHLLQTFSFLENENMQVGAVASKAFNKQTGTPYSYGTSMLNPRVANQIAEVSYAMNSISLFRTDYFREVGLMDEALFIDGVDSEICWRGAPKGFRFFVDERVLIAHLLGMGSRKILGKEVSISSPMRMYFQFRNYIVLCHRKYTPAVWKWNNGFKYLIKMVYYPLLVSPRGQYIKNIALGVWAGVKTSKKSKNKKNI